MLEVRLIDANAFLERVLPECKYPDALREAVERQPTIEPEVKHPKTNSDKIRAMDDEELAYFLMTTSCSICCYHPLDCGFECASLYTIKAEKTEQVSPLDRLAAEYDRKHPNGLKFTYSPDEETKQTEQEEKEND